MTARLSSRVPFEAMRALDDRDLGLVLLLRKQLAAGAISRESYERAMAPYEAKIRAYVPLDGERLGEVTP